MHEGTTHYNYFPSLGAGEHESSSLNMALGPAMSNSFYSGGQNDTENSSTGHNSIVFT